MKIENIRKDASILLIDDEPVIAELLSGTLQMHGYEHVYCISDSEKILDYIDNYNINLIVLDFNLPHLSSIDIVRQVKKIKGDVNIPIIIQTAKTDINAHKKLMKEGVKCVLTKSCSLSNFLRIIHSLLETNLYHKNMEHEAIPVSSCIDTR